jgi:hypothetical protein
MAQHREAYRLRHSLSHPVRALRQILNPSLAARMASVALAASLLFFGGNSAHAVDMTGLVQPAAIDQPQINMLVRTINNGVVQDPQVGQTLDIGFDNQGNPIIVQNNTINISAYLDTGSSSILISTDTAQTWVDANNQGIPTSTYNGQPVKFADIGVGGTANFSVSKPVVVQLAPYTPTVNSAVAGTTSTAQYNPQYIPAQLVVGPDSTGSGSLDSLGTDDVEVVGMPALAGKVMVVDTKHLNDNVGVLSVLNGGDIFGLTQADLDNVSLRTYVYNPGTAFNSGTADTNPGIPSTNLHVKTSYADFSGFTTTTPTGAPGPTLAHNPIIGPNPLAAPGTDNTPSVRLTYKVPNSASPGKLLTMAATGSFLFDTGAGASFVSTKIASELHIRYRPGTQGTDNPVLELYDPNNPSAPGTLLQNQFQEAIGGIGPSAVAAGFYLDSVIVPTSEANPKYYNDPRNLRFNGTRATDGTQNVLGPAVLVQDITATKNGQSFTLDGDFGMNFLVGSIDMSGTSLDNIVIGAALPSAFNWFTFDEPNGTIGLQLNSAFHIAGDFNLDGKLDISDTQAMLNALKNISAFKTAHSLSDADWLDLADVNRDGQVNGSDEAFLANLLTGNRLYQAGDFNMDGKVTISDLQAMLQALKNTSDFEASHDLSPQAWEEIGDVNGDGRVDMTDLAALMSLLANSGGSGSVASVPEPATWLLAVIAASMCLLARSLHHRTAILA